MFNPEAVNNMGPIAPSNNEAQNVDVIDNAIMNLNASIDKMMCSEEPKWDQIDILLRQLAVLMFRKAGRNEQALSESAVEQMKEEIKEIKLTYNSKTSLLFSFGCGAVTIISGLLGLGSGVGQMCGVSSKLLDSAGKMGSVASKLASGVEGTFGQYFSKRDEKNRTWHNYLMEDSRTNKQTYDAGAGNNRNSQNSLMAAIRQLQETAARARSGMVER